MTPLELIASSKCTEGQMVACFGVKTRNVMARNVHVNDEAKLVFVHGENEDHGLRSVEDGIVQDLHCQTNSRTYTIDIWEKSPSGVG